MSNIVATARTGNNAIAYDHSEDHLLEFFSKAGSLFVSKGTYYGNEASAVELFKNAWRTGNNVKCMQLLMWVRSIRDGAGNRSGFRACINWLAKTEPDWIIANIKSIPVVGRWDDLYALYKTDCEKAALKLWASAIKKGDGLACKWADRNDSRLRNYMELSPKAYRKLLVKNTNVVETLMCKKNWDDINYEHVPSVALSRYNKAFTRNDKDRFTEYRNGLVKINKDGTVELTGKVNAGAIYPHDLIRTVNSDSSMETEKLVEGMFLSLPNFMEKNKMRIMPILDFSGSMCIPVSGSIQAIEVALGLGLYCSDRVGADNPFYRKVIPFSQNARFESWKGKTFANAVKTIPDHYCGSTNIKSALKLILDAGVMFNASKDQMPNMLLIISDMQFDEGCTDTNTPVEESLMAWENAGYKKPTIIYWNLAGYGNQPTTKFHKNVGLVSGFSPSILEAVLSGTDFTPMSIMNKTIEKYKIVVPK